MRETESNVPEKERNSYWDGSPGISLVGTGKRILGLVRETHATAAGYNRPGA